MQTGLQPSGQFKSPFSCFKNSPNSVDDETILGCTPASLAAALHHGMANWISAMLPCQGSLALASGGGICGIYPYMAFSPYGG